MDKLKMVYLNSGVLFSNKKEQSTDSYYKVSEPSKHGKWKEPHTKGHILYEMSRVGKSIEIEGSFVVAWEWEERGIGSDIYFCFIDYAKAFDCVDHNNCGKFWRRWEYQTTWPASWETCMQVFRKQQLELDMEQQTGSK